MQVSVRTQPRRANGFVQGISVVVIAAMACLSLKPQSAAAQARELFSSPIYRYVPSMDVPSTGTASDNPSWFASTNNVSRRGLTASQCPVTTPSTPPTVDEQYSRLLDEIMAQVKRAKAQRTRGMRADAEIKSIRAHAKNLNALDAAVDTSFMTTEQELKDKKLPPVLLDRHRIAVNQFKARRGQFKQLLQQFTDADDKNMSAAREAAMEKLITFFAQHRQGHTHKLVDPNKLPFRMPGDKVRAPATSPSEFPTTLFDKDSSRRAAQTQADSQRSFVDASIAPPTADDLASTEDVQLTQPIQDLAASLNNNPVKIYNWVRNNIQWLPTYGSVQGSDMTLLTRRGNAFDTASLLIALYRAAGIPARYVYGTIEVPVDQVMNWVGGVTHPEAAQQLMGQGGIPNVALVNGGVIQSIELEHVWVEAFVDYVPSRGALNHVPDTWVPMDPSFKQYEFVAPMEFRSEITADIHSAAVQAASTAVVDSQMGSVTGLDEGAILDFNNSIDSQIEEKLRQVASFYDLTGRRKILVQESSVLASSLATKVVARMGRFSQLPDGLRHKLSLNLYATELDRTLGNSSAAYSISLPKLAGKRLGVTYVPASVADATALADYRSQPVGKLPLYLINVRPSVQIDGAEQVLGPSSMMGLEQYWDAQLTGPGGEITHQHAYSISTGDELVFGVNPNGVPEQVVHRRFLQGPSETASENLHTVSLVYWMQYDVLNEGVAATRGAVIQRAPSIGLFSAPLQVQYYFGIPRTGYYGPRQMDISDSVIAAVQKQGGSTLEVHRQSGIVGSLLEGRTFEELFEKQFPGASSVQLLTEANRQHIPVYLMTAYDYGAIAPSLQVDPDVESEIANAVQAGMHVLVSQKAPDHGEWKGVGYIIQDPQTGAAAYLIQGGLNGGAQTPCDKKEATAPASDFVIEVHPAAYYLAAFLLILILLPESVVVGGILVLQRMITLLLLGLASTALAGPSSPPRLGDGLLPPGTCTWSQYLALVAEKKAVCDQTHSCKQFNVAKGTADCDEVRRQFDLAQRCYAARNLVMVTCFMGGDSRHFEYLEEQVLPTIERCACAMAKHGC